MSPLSQFLAGAITAGYLLAGVFFLRFWTRSRDLLFIAFSIAFWLLALGQIILAIGNIPNEERSWAYLLRLVAFALIAAAIVHKNAGPRRR